ncbi:MAG: matrixin family metalloprotease [bacterium]
MLHGSKLTIRTLLIVCCGVALLIVGVVFAYVRNGQDWTYQANPMGENYVVFENTNDTTGELTAIQAAAATWNADAAKFNFTYGGPGTNTAPVFDGVNQIRWGTTSGSLATTTWWYNTSTGDITETDCVFNDPSYTWSTATPTPAGQYDIQSVMLHEFGHFLSLGHSTPPAIMQPTIPSGTQRRTLNADDQNGIRAIYGKVGGGCSTLGLSTEVVSPGPSQTMVNVCLLFSTLLLIPVVRVFSHRKKTN